MKKLFALLLAVLMIASLVACTKEPAEEPAESGEDPAVENTDATEEAPNIAGLANPITEYATLDEVNAAAGTKFVKLSEGVSDEVYTTIKGEPVVGQYQFTMNGAAYTWRAANTTENIAGIYEDALESEYPDANDKPAFQNTENFRIAFWLVDETTQYVLTTSTETNEETFRSLTYMLVAMTASKGTYTALAGAYMDSFSQRASAEICDNGDNAGVRIHWASSAFDYTEWTMTVTYDNGKLVYTDCEKSNATSTDGNEPEVTVEFSDGEGYFELVDNKLAWTGAAEESCRECVFEKFGTD